jgi:hypothetical protein
VALLVPVPQAEASASRTVSMELLSPSRKKRFCSASTPAGGLMRKTVSAPPGRSSRLRYSDAP